MCNMSTPHFFASLFIPRPLLPFVLKNKTPPSHPHKMMRLLASSLLSSANHQFASASVPAAIVVVPSIRRCLLSTSTVAMGHGSHSSDNRPDILEQEKQKNLKGLSRLEQRKASSATPAISPSVLCLSYCSQQARQERLCPEHPAGTLRWQATQRQR